MATVWEQAQSKQARRRERGRARAVAGTVDDGMFMEDLTRLGTRFHVADAKGNNTTAVGAVHVGDGDPALYISFKGPPLQTAENVFLAAQALGLPIALVDDVRVLGNTSGLHCEMDIVREATGGDKALLSNSEFRLEIACIGKGVCPDCSVFLQKYGIPHTPTRAKVSTDWVNPFSGAHYTGTGNTLQCIKAGRTFTATTKPVEYRRGWGRAGQ